MTWSWSVKEAKISGVVALAMAVPFLPIRADAHAIAGDHYFPATYTFDDPAVSDEMTFPAFGSLKHSDDAGTVLDQNFPVSFSRLLLPNLMLGVDSGYDRRSWGETRRDGMTATTLSVKTQVLRDDDRETLAAVKLGWAIGGSGAADVGANAPDILKPGVFFGQGLGNLPQALYWLRPLAVMGAVEGAFATRHGTVTNMGTILGTGLVGPQATRETDHLHWGMAFSYSTHYVQDWGPHWPYQHEPLNQFVPVMELAFDSGVGTVTTGTVNPGLAYVAERYQVLGEASLPINGATGHNVGFQAQLTLFIDDLMPSLFGKPVFEP
jgi:hypothetical protein